MRNTRTGDGRTLRRGLTREAANYLAGALMAVCAVWEPSALLVPVTMIAFWHMAAGVVGAFTFREDDRMSTWARYETRRRARVIERIEI